MKSEVSSSVRNTYICICIFVCIMALTWQLNYFHFKGVVDIQAKFLYSGLNCMCVRILTIFVIVNNVTTFEYKHVPNLKNPEILLILSLHRCIKFETYSCKIWRDYDTHITSSKGSLFQNYSETIWIQI